LIFLNRIADQLPSMAISDTPSKPSSFIRACPVSRLMGLCPLYSSFLSTGFMRAPPS